MSNGTLEQPIRTTHPTKPNSGRMLKYMFDSGSAVTPYYMGSDGIPHPVIPITDHNALTNNGSNSHTQIDSHLAAINNPHQTSYNDLLNKPNFFRYTIQAGHSNLPSNGTESSFSYGHNNANDGITAMANGEIEGLSVRVENGRADGSATYIVAINDVNFNVAGRRVVIDGNVNAEGEISSTSGAIIFSPPLPYLKGDQIEVRAVTSNWDPTSSDSTVLLRMKENLL